MDNKEEEINRLLDLAEELFVAEQYQQAIDILDKVLDIEPKNTIALNSKAAALANLGMHDQAIEYYDKELEIEPNFIPTLTAKAFALASLGRYKEAIKYCDKVLEIEPKNILALTNKAFALASLGRYKESIEYCNKVLEIEPKNILALNNTAFALLNLGRYQEAIEECDKVLEIDKKNIFALTNKAFALAKLGRYKETIEECDKALEIDKKNIWAINNKATALSYLGEHKETIKLYNEALVIAPSRLILSNKYLSIKNLPNNEIALYIDEELLNQTKKCNITILEVVALIYNQNNAKEIYDKLKELLNKLLDAGKDDIYKDAIKDIVPNKENLSSYKSIYIESLLLVALLRVDMQKESGKKSDSTSKRAEDDVAHYTRKCVAERMLFKDQKDNNGTRSNFRLSSIVKANDPDEGNTLLSFLGIDSCFHQLDEYAAFIGCFTFNHSSLNQFRLYGKEDNREATGVSLVLKRDFFAADMQEGVMAQYSAKDFTTTDMKQGVMTTSSKLQFPQNTQDEQVSKAKEKEEDKKYPLFRCIYVDPKTGKVISVGHREEYTFYRESSAKWTNEEIIEYKKETEELLVIIKEGFESLKQEIQQLKTEDDKKIVYQLLIQLRYLVKHMAFKEEQECRIIRIEELYNNNKIQVENDSRMYIDYRPIYDVISHVYFAPQASDYKLFRNRIAKDYGDKPKCRQCDHPFSC